MVPRDLLTSARWLHDADRCFTPPSAAPRLVLAFLVLLAGEPMPPPTHRLLEMPSDVHIHVFCTPLCRHLEKLRRSVATLSRTTVDACGSRAVAFVVPRRKIRRKLFTRFDALQAQTVLHVESHIVLARRAAQAISSYPRNATFAAHHSLACSRRF